MFTTLERKRQISEDLELIENAIVKRLCINPGILNNDTNTNTNFEKSTTIMMKHEINKLINCYETQLNELKNVMNDDDSILHDLKILTSDNLINYKSYNNNNTNIDHQIYEFFSSDENFPIIKKQLDNNECKNNEKYNYLSKYASDLNKLEIFDKFEHFGDFLNLREFYNIWKSLHNEQIDYKQYVKDITKRSNIILTITNQQQYEDYLTQLLHYLLNFYERLNPFNLIPILEETNSFKHDSHYCLSCCKLFSNESSYNSHLQGKKHLKNQLKFSQILTTESKILSMIGNLENIWINTINEIERFELLTYREREMEKKGIGKKLPISTYHKAPIKLFLYNNNDEINDLNIKNDEIEDEEMLNNPLNLPIGLDGKPIPFWLWKLKGLSHIFQCEICDNEKFQGRSNFNKHFNNEKHREGLKKMGINVKDFKYFKDINNKKEIEEIINYLNKKNREEIQFNDDSEQVEDEFGNLMNKKVYEQLKKQGLL